MSTSIADAKTDLEVNIRLRRLNSATSSATALPPYKSTALVTNPFLSPDDDASSIVSTLSINTSLPSTTFKPSHAFQIQAEGKRAISFPIPPRQLSTPIYALPLHANFSDTNPTPPVYLSVRPMRKSGSCTLIRGDDEYGTAVARTTYAFGPGKPPKVWIANNDGGEEFEMHSKSLFSRTVTFTSAHHGTFQWRYASKSEKRRYSSPAPNNLLLLEKGEENIVIARLVRSDETRTEGSKASCAGNGGLLEASVLSEEEGVLVLATVLVMLKKEIDRLRAIQIGVMSGAGGGGG